MMTFLLLILAALAGLVAGAYYPGVGKFLVEKVREFFK